MQSSRSSWRKSKLNKSTLSNSFVEDVIGISIAMNLKLGIAKNIIFFFTNSYAKTVMKTFTANFMIKITTITMMKSKKMLKLKS